MEEVATLPQTRWQGRDRAATPFYAITPFTMLDFPGHTACIIWVAGCNMRCGYCHNPQIVLGKGTIREEEAMDFLGRRKGLLDGVVLSGGEATSWPGLVGFAQEVKAMGFTLKLDTNGLRPDVVTQLLDRRLIDRIALDYKAPRAKFHDVTGVTAWQRFSATLDLLCAQGEIPFEVRTTVHDALMDENDVLAITRDLKGRGYDGVHALQIAVIDPDRPTLGALPLQRRDWDLAVLQERAPLSLVLRQQ